MIHQGTIVGFICCKLW